MNSIYASLALILSEVVLILLTICGGVLFLKFRERRKDKQAIKALTEKLTSGRDERLNVLSIKLKESLNLEGDELTAAAQEIVQKENKFYADVVKLYSTHDSAALEGIDQKVAGLAETYSKMGSAPAAEGGGTTPPEVMEELTSLRNENARIRLELESLQETNEKLVEELEATRQEMRETVAEFVSAFSGGREEAEKKMNNMDATPAAAQETASEAPSEPPPEPPPTEESGSETTAELSPETAAEEESEEPDASEEPAAADEADSAEASDVTEEPAAEEKGNPFLSIGDTPAATDDEDDTTIDRVMNDLDSDLGLKPEAEQPEASVAKEPPAEEAVDSDDIDALLEANNADTSATEPETPPAETATEEELSGDDIDAILDGLTDSESESEVRPDEAATENQTEEAPISDDDIDAILDDIDITSAEALGGEQKEPEKAAT